MSLPGSKEGYEPLQVGDEKNCMVLTTGIPAVTRGSHPGAEHQLLLFFAIVKMGNPAVGYRPIACKC